MKTKAIIDTEKKQVEIHGQMGDGELWFLRYHFEVNELEIKAQEENKNVELAEKSFRVR